MNTAATWMYSMMLRCGFVSSNLATNACAIDEKEIMQQKKRAKKELAIAKGRGGFQHDDVPCAGA